MSESPCIQVSLSMWLATYMQIDVSVSTCDPDWRRHKIGEDEGLVCECPYLHMTLESGLQGVDSALTPGSLPGLPRFSYIRSVTLTLSRSLW